LAKKNGFTVTITLMGSIYTMHASKRVVKQEKEKLEMRAEENRWDMREKKETKLV